jgi:hypothetical protein
MNFQRIKTLQKEYGYSEVQELINSGMAWKLEGSVGRNAMQMLEYGYCMLPKIDRFDTYGNTVPSRDKLKAGTKGTYKNCKQLWERVENGEIDLNLEIDI